MSRKNAGNRTIRKDEKGTIYKDIVFVPSGTLSTKDPASTSQPNKQDATNIREFYRNVLAMPKTLKKPAKKKQIGQPPKKQESSASHSIKETSTSVESATAPDQDPGLTLTGSQTTSNPTLSTSAAEEIVRRNWQGNHGSNRVVAEGYTLCETCQIEVREDDLVRHRQGIAHLMAQESPIKPLDTLTLGHENKGFKMLVNSGWDYEKGLGAEGQGARHPIATRLKHDRLALGADGANRKAVTHTFEEIEKSRTKPTAKSNRRVPLNVEDHRRMAEKERQDRVKMMNYMKK